MNDREKLLKLAELSIDFKKDLSKLCYERMCLWTENEDLSGNHEELTYTVCSHIVATLLYTCIEVVFITYEDVNQEEMKIMMDKFFIPTYRFINKMRQKAYEKGTEK